MIILDVVPLWRCRSGNYGRATRCGALSGEDARNVKLTGNKWADKMYYHHTGYPGGIKSISAEKLHEKKPEEIIRLAVKGMLPKNRLGRKIFKKLKVYARSDHPHASQQPVSRVEG